MVVRMKKKALSINDFVDFNLFANMHNLDADQLRYRIRLGQVHPMPVKFGFKFVFEPDAVIIVPAKKKPPGRPKGSTIANGARKLGYPRAVKKNKARK